MRNKANLLNIDLSDLVRYPGGRIKNNTGSGNGTPVNEVVYGDIHEAKDKLMRRYGIAYNDLPDNEENGYQLLEALMALPTKNDFVLNLGSSTGVLTVPVKLSKLEVNECFILKATVDKTTETTIIGSDLVTKTVTFIGNFKANEFVRMISTSSSIILVRLVDATNLETAVNELLFLRKASQTEENEGVLETVATTPKVNKITFTKRVNGDDSLNYLAKPTGNPDARNGLLSAADKKKIDDFGVSNEKNYGTFTGSDFDDNPIGTNYTVTGNILTAQKTANTGDGGVITCTLANSMNNDNYQVNLSIESIGPFESDSQIRPLIWKKISSNQIAVYIHFTSFAGKTLKIHVEVKQR